MATGSTATRPFGQVVAFLPPKDITFATAGLATGVSIGKIPRGSRNVRVTTAITTGFSAAGTRVLTVGTNSTSYNNLVTTVTEETAQTASHVLGAALTFTQDTEVFVKVTTTGTAAAAGAASIFVEFLAPLELT